MDRQITKLKEEIYALKKENKNFPFSWDDEKYSIEATIKLKKDLYDINKNICSYWLERLY